MAGNLPIKRIFEVPAFTTPDGTLHLWPCFHRSPIFTAGGHDWSISYYPESIYSSDSIDLCLQLESEGAGVTISSSVALLDPTPSLPLFKLVEESPPMELDHAIASRSTVTHWVPKSKLSAAPVGDRDSLIFVWAITILTQTPMPVPLPLPEPEPEPEPMMAAMPEVPAEDVAPPSPVPATMTNVASEAKVPATDVTYSVGGQLFHAHKVVLATRSPVFEAQLFGGPTSTAEASHAPAAAVVEVDDMRPDVFEALLHYIYTGTLPATEGEAGDDEDASHQMMRHLLVAADRYDLEGLKLQCEGELARTLGEGNMAEMLAFADDHYCSTLKDACVGFMVASPAETMERVVASYGYQRLRLRHPLILVDVLEKSLMFRKA
ncbi:BTB/POZ and MATH domain-containing protein 2-like [Panicum miliaceum]|uniref:BTB/POZ and MATH domain-containing protein 2-like n=1 Tax=Panicum miliaceum TaxID=4540 RepID=A0A3L6PRA6_PANMI|nr:BTB/POZ and MATH domain-containing protein 2-like [Panicum miliaceum]